MQDGWNSHKILQGCGVKTATRSLTHSWTQTTLVCQSARPRRAHNLEFCYFSFRPLQLSRTICSTQFLFFLCEMVSHFFYVTVRKYNQPALALRKTTSQPVLWEGVLSDWSTKYKGIFKLPARQNLLRLMLQKQRNNLTNHCVRLCLLWVSFFLPQNQEPAEPDTPQFKCDRVQQHNWLNAVFAHIILI